MAKCIKLSLALGVVLSSSLTAMHNINIGELVGKAKEFGAKVRELAMEKGWKQEGLTHEEAIARAEHAIREAIKEATHMLPDRILGINTEVIRTGQIDIAPETAQRIAQYIPQTLNVLRKVHGFANSFVQEPEGALMLFTTLNNFVQNVDIHEAIKKAADKAHAILESNKGQLHEIFRPIAQLVNNFIGMLEKLEKNTHDTRAFTETLQEVIRTDIKSPEFNKIKDEVIRRLVGFVENNKQAFRELVEKINKLNDLTPDQLQQAFDVIKAQIKR
jgi:phosphoenolpyruvate carboxylase